VEGGAHGYVARMAPLVLKVSGPIDAVELLDPAWQDGPVWGEDPWVALDAPSLTYPGPPWPGFLLRVAVPADEQLRMTLGSERSASAQTSVLKTELIVGEHGIWLGVGVDSRQIDIPSGNYAVEVWVAPLAPGSTREVSVVLGDPMPRCLPGQLRADDAAQLLDDLCVQLGYCLPPEDRQRIIASPPLSIDAFTDAVMEAEGLDPVLMDSQQRWQVRRLVADAFGEPPMPTRRTWRRP